MKLYMVSLVLLMAPMAFAKLPLSVASRIIYDHGYILSETKEGIIEHRNSGADFYLTFDLDGWLYMKDVVTLDRQRNIRRANLTFVAEVMLMPNGSRYPLFGSGFDCFKETDESLRHLLGTSVLKTCFGKTRLRKLTKEETDQMNRFKSSPEAAMGHKFNVIFDSNQTNVNLTSWSVGFDRLTVDRRHNRLEIAAVETIYDKKTGYYVGEKIRKQSLFRYEDKSLIVEGTEEPVDCFETDVENLWVVRCQGNIRARGLKDGDLPKLI